MTPMTPTGRCGRRAGGWLPIPPTRSAPVGRRSPASPGTRPAPTTMIYRLIGLLAARSRWSARVPGGSCSSHRGRPERTIPAQPGCCKALPRRGECVRMAMAERARPVARARSWRCRSPDRRCPRARGGQALALRPPLAEGALAVIHFRGRASPAPASWPVYRLAAHPEMCVRLDRACRIPRDSGRKPALPGQCHRPAAGDPPRTSGCPGRSASTAAAGAPPPAAPPPRNQRSPSPDLALTPARPPPRGRWRPGLRPPTGRSAFTSAASTAPARSPT